MWFLDGVKYIIELVHLDRTDRNGQDSDLSSLLDWVYYYDVMARFGLRHWQREASSSAPTSSCIRAKVSP